MIDNYGIDTLAAGGRSNAAAATSATEPARIVRSCISFCAANRLRLSRNG